ncbi:SAM-dependent methyltransferase [Amycolatopsis thermophila]|uniref:SAM-dependent methyltransferase n=1 Tax=Amycolatopsis thermophila TaxID=206084 RepID=A0ABU0F3H2_9PSEU|nr:SAM-dependent methyltransferase [Amycolatopsis thermophila]
MTGFDSSARMVELARQRLSADAAVQVADLGSPLPFPDGAFDDVVAALVLHYLGDWTAPLAELRRVLRPRGRLIVSVHHPTEGRADLLAAGFRTAVISEPRPAPGARDLFRDELADRSAFLCFLFFVLEAASRSNDER